MGSPSHVSAPLSKRLVGGGREDAMADLCHAYGGRENREAGVIQEGRQEKKGCGWQMRSERAEDGVVLLCFKVTPP